MALQGTLSHFPLREEIRYPYFTTGRSDKAVIFIGGLFNGLGDVPFLPALGAALVSAGWELVQFHWSSAYTNFGTSSLDVDVEEMSKLVAHLRSSHKTIVIMGHSTGSQDVLHYLLNKTGVDGGIMQAPVSDREHFPIADEFGWMVGLPRATELVKAGKGSQLMEEEFNNAVGMRFTAYRLWSLLSPSGEDDYFSSDLPVKADGIHAHPLSETFGKLKHPTLALFSEKDQFAHIEDIETHLKRWKDVAKGKLVTAVIPGATHAVDDEKLWPILCKEVLDWLQCHFP